MRKIKKFKEHIIPLYKVGDYVCLDELNWNITLTINCGKIVGSYDNFYDSFFNFEVVANNDIYILMGTEKSIIRESTPEEIKEFKILKSATKFNL